MKLNVFPSLHAARWTAACVVVSLAALAHAQVVINEVFYNAPGDLDDLQWVELHNAGAQAVELGGWSFSKGVKLTFKPGTRIVTNSFTMEDWMADETANVTENCSSWCQAMLWVVPAKVAGTWQTPQGPLVLQQEFQMLNGSLGSTSIVDAKMRGEQIMFTVGTVKYTGTVSGNAMKGTTSVGGSWTATRQ